jgi:hypothetical protein
MSEDNSPLGMARKEMDRTCFLCGEKGLHLFADWDEDLKCLTDYWFECDCCSGYQILVYDSLDELMAKLADIQSRRANRWSAFSDEELKDISLTYSPFGRQPKFFEETKAELARRHATGEGEI